MATEINSEPFDASVRESQEWLEDVMRETGSDRDLAFQALRAVLHALREEMTQEQSAHLAAQMPLLIRGLYFEAWDPNHHLAADHTPERFIDRVRAHFKGYSGELDYRHIIRGVLRVIERHMPGPAAKMKRTFPKELRAFWPTTVGEQTAERHAQLEAEERIAMFEALHVESGHERGAPMAPHQNRPPGEQHRGGPLPNRM